MERKTLNAGRLRQAEYDRKEQSLRIEFANGSTKTFRPVPQEVWRRFTASPSPAAFYEDRIEEEYPVAEGRAVGGTDARGKLDALFGGGAASNGNEETARPDGDDR